MVDQSGSIQEPNWSLVKEFILEIVNNFNVGYDQTRVGLVTFGNQGIVRFDLTTHLTSSDIARAIRSIGAGNGNTNTYLGLLRMRTQCFGTTGDRPDVANVAIVITDGVSTVQRTQTIPEAERAHAEGIQVFTVGVTDEVNLDEVRAISSPPREVNRNYWTSPDFLSLSDVVASLQQETCRPPPVGEKKISLRFPPD